LLAASLGDAAARAVDRFLDEALQVGAHSPAGALRVTILPITSSAAG
jgi:hypothetical protein